MFGVARFGSTLPLSTFNLDEAIAESLRAEAEFRRYNASATALTDCLESNGFVELSVDLTRDELLQGYEALTYVEPALASSGTSHFDSSIGSFAIRPIAPVMTVPPTALQFYFDLFGLGDPEKHAYNEVLVSYLHLHDDREQTYKLYACDSLADIEFLLSSIRNEPALIFTGRFQTRNGAYRMPLNTQRAQQRTLNAICVDIDPSHNGVEDEDGPIDPVVLERIFERIDGRLLPSYVCLTGRGIHLWYIFDEPLQTFRIHNPRRTKYKALADALYAYYGLICFDLPCVLDTHCTSLNHGFRAPGSLTKRGEVVRCFCPVDRVFKHSDGRIRFRFLMFWLLSIACHMIPNWFFAKMMCGGSRSRISPTRLKLARRPLKKSPQVKISSYLFAIYTRKVI